MPLPNRIGSGQHQLGISADLAKALDSAMFADDHIENHAALNVLFSCPRRILRLNPLNQISVGDLLRNQYRMCGDVAFFRGRSRSRGFGRWIFC